MRPRSTWPLGQRAAIQACLLVALATLVALVVNGLRPQGLPLIGSRAPEARLTQEAGGSLIIPLEEAAELYRQGVAIFVDARPAEFYELGHIKGARSLPWEQFEEIAPRALQDLAPDAIVITYCDGPNCRLSEALALALLERGYAEVRVLVNGWSRWRQRGLPVATGPRP